MAHILFFCFVLMLSVHAIQSVFCEEYEYHKHRRRHRHRHPPGRIVFLTEGKKVEKLKMKVDNKLPITISLADKFGNPASGGLDAAPQISLDDASLGTLEVAQDGMSAVFTPSGKLGKCNILASGLSQGKQLSGSLEVQCEAGSPASLSIKAGDPIVG